MGVLVAVSIPIFTAQLDKAKIATNKANMRAARAAASVQFYEDLADAKLGGDAFAYYHYDTATGKLIEKDAIYGDDTNRSTKLPEGNKAGVNCRNSVKNGEVYKYIMVYVSETDKQKGASIQTASYYDDNDKIYTGTNPYGPYAGK